MLPSTKFNIILIVLCFIYAHGLKVIFESVKFTYINDKYLEGMGVNIRRYTRKGNYYLNLWGRTKHTWGNNITVTMVMTEFLHNEYRRSFVEFHYRLCDFINKEPYFGAALKQQGIVCPAPKGEYRLMNMSTQTHDFPNVWPFEKGGADVIINITDTGELVGTGYLHCTFKQDRKKN